MKTKRFVSTSYRKIALVTAITVAVVALPLHPASAEMTIFEEDF